MHKKFGKIGFSGWKISEKFQDEQHWHPFLETVCHLLSLSCDFCSGYQVLIAWDDDEASDVGLLTPEKHKQNTLNPKTKCAQMARFIYRSFRHCFLRRFKMCIAVAWCGHTAKYSPSNALPIKLSGAAGASQRKRRCGAPRMAQGGRLDIKTQSLRRLKYFQKTPYLFFQSFSRYAIRLRNFQHSSSKRMKKNKNKTHTQISTWLKKGYVICQQSVDESRSNLCPTSRSLRLCEHRYLWPHLKKNGMHTNQHLTVQL